MVRSRHRRPGSARRGWEGWAFAGTFVTIALAVTSLFVALYPDVMPSTLDPAWSLTVERTLGPVDAHGGLIEYVEAEMRPNGGASVKDAITRPIEHAVIDRSKRSVAHFSQNFPAGVLGAVTVGRRLGAGPETPIWPARRFARPENRVLPSPFS